MAINYPTSLDSFTNPVGTNNLGTPAHATQHANANDAIVVLETKVGLSAGTPTADKVFVGSGAGTSVWSGAWNNGTLGTAVLQRPRVTTSIDDSNGNEVIKTPATASAVNEITVTNAGTSSSPSITATGGDTNINLLADGKATGMFIPRMATPQGYLINGKITTSVASNNLTVAIKTIQGNDPSASDPVYVRIGNTVRSITSALSVTKNAGTNWFNSGASDHATYEVDYFVYLGYNSTDGTVLGFARIPYARVYSDFSTTSTAITYSAISTITNASASDEYEVVGRFNATLSATASFNWSIPGTSIIINRPIFETRLLTHVPTHTGWSSPPTVSAQYIVRGNICYYHYVVAGAGTSNATTATISLPFEGKMNTRQDFSASGAVDNSAYANNGTGRVRVGNSQALLTWFKNNTTAAWTASGNKYMENIEISYFI